MPALDQEVDFEPLGAAVEEQVRDPLDFVEHSTGGELGEETSRVRRGELPRVQCLERHVGLLGEGHLAERRLSRLAADRQIAAIARVDGLVLVTANPRDLRRFDGLSIENWSR